MRGAMGWAERIQSEDGDHISLHGEIDLSNVDTVRREIERLVVELRSEPVVIDLSGVEYIDSQGVALLLKFAHQLSERQTQLRLVAPADSVAGELLSTSPVAELLCVSPVGERPLDRSVD
jgi:anti-anti-sigma factor